MLLLLLLLKDFSSDNILVDKLAVAIDVAVVVAVVGVEIDLVFIVAVLFIRRWRVGSISCGNLIVRRRLSVDKLYAIVDVVSYTNMTGGARGAILQLLLLLESMKVNVKV